MSKSVGQTERLPARAPSYFIGHNLPLWQILTLVGALALLYAPILKRLFLQWYQDADTSYGFLVLLFASLLVWQRRSILEHLPNSPSWWGLAILLSGIVVLIAGSMAAELFLARVSLVIALAGLLVLFLGWGHLRALWLPLFALLLMIPLPRILLDEITLPLQHETTVVSASTLALAGIPVLREGNIIGLPRLELGVAEACSGIRSLMSLVALALMYGYFREQRAWIRATLVVISVPIAVVANSARIVVTGLLVQYWSPERALGFFHEFSGFMVFVISVALLIAAHAVLRQIAAKTGRTEVGAATTDGTQS